MEQVKTTVELPKGLRDAARDLAAASDLNFQQYVRRLLVRAVVDQKVFGPTDELPMAASFVSGRDEDPGAGGGK